MSEGNDRRNTEILSMDKKLQISFSEQEKAQYERIKRRHNIPLSKSIHKTEKIEAHGHLASPKQTGRLPSLSDSRQDEPIIFPAFEIFLEGMKRGNKRDRVAAESILNASQYKKVSHSFFKMCEQKYRDTLNLYERSNLSIQASNISHSSISVSPDIKITQRIFFPPNMTQNLTQ